MDSALTDTRCLYKYRAIDKYTFELLVNNEMWFAHPASFNDPFDSKVDYIYKSNKREHWIQWLDSQQLSSTERKLILAKMDEDMQQFEAVANQTYRPEKLFDAIGIASFSCDNTNILMWSHYAENHQGVCLGFKTENLEKMVFDAPINDLPVFEVKYQSVLPLTFNGLTDDPQRLTEFMSVKYKGWKYEKEYRVIALMDHIKSRKVRFKKNLLSEVIFGSRVVEDEKRVIKEVVKNHYIDKGCPVRFFQAKEERRAYRLTLEEE